MAKKIITFLLFRQKMLTQLEYMHRTVLIDASLRENEEEKPIERFLEIVRDSLRYQVNMDWYLHGRLAAAKIPQVLQVANADVVSHLDMLSYVHELSRSYSWCIIPWGVYGTGQMIALITSDEDTSKKARDWLIRGESHDLVVSSYSADELEEKRFKGAIFRGSDDFRGRQLWRSGRGSSDSALVLTYDSDPSSPSELPANADVVCEMLGYQIQPVLRRWIRVRDSNGLQHYLSRHTAIVTAPELDERLMWLALQDFAGVANHVNADRLYFGLKVLETASWIYIPKHDDPRWEIYMSRDPAVVDKFLQNEDPTHASHFSHKFFC